MTENDLAQRLRDRAYSGLPDPLSEQAANEIERLRLTDAEREAVGVAIQCVVAAKAQRHPEEEESHELLHITAATLRGLLERTGTTEAERSPDKLSPQT
jgi:hypothetical protein